MVRVEVRVGGRFGPPKKDGRRGEPVLAFELPETVVDYCRKPQDFAPLPVPPELGAVYLYMGTEQVYTATTKDHEASLARQSDLSEVEHALAERRAELREVQQQHNVLAQGVELMKTHLQLLEGQRKDVAQALQHERERAERSIAQEHARLDAERTRAQAEITQLGEWVEGNRKQALAVSDQAVAQLVTVTKTCEQQTQTIGAIANSVLDREGMVAQLSAMRQVEGQNQAVATTDLLGGLVQQVREMTRTASLVPTGPGAADKLVDFLREVVLGDVGLTLINMYASKNGLKTKTPGAPAPAVKG